MCRTAGKAITAESDRWQSEAWGIRKYLLHSFI